MNQVHFGQVECDGHERWKFFQAYHHALPLLALGLFGGDTRALAGEEVFFVDGLVSIRWNIHHVILQETGKLCELGKEIVSPPQIDLSEGMKVEMKASL